MRHMKVRSGWLHTAAALFVAAVIFNYAWEMAQSPLYRDQAAFPALAWHCLIASLGDGVIVVFIWAAGAYWFRAHAWFRHPRARGYSLMLLVGLFIAVLIEWIALSAGRWSYTSRMPRLGELGLVPVLQMLVLPPIIFATVARTQRRVSRGDA